MGKQKLNKIQKFRKISSKINKNISKDELKEQDGIINISKDSELICSICYSSITDQGIIQNCQHTFCFQCIQKWSKHNLTCPQCRADFTKIIRIQKEGQLQKQKTYTFKQPKQSDDQLLNIILTQQLSSILFFLIDMVSEDQMD